LLQSSPGFLWKESQKQDTQEHKHDFSEQDLNNNLAGVVPLGQGNNLAMRRQKTGA